MDQHQKRERTSEGVIKPKVGRGVRPIAKTQNFTQEGATGQNGGSGDEPGRTWRSPDTSLNKAKPGAAIEGSGVRRFVREKKQLKTQNISPGPDTEGQLDLKGP
jgi:hypothetical protein